MKRAVDQMKIAIVRISKFASVMNQHVHKFSVDTSEAVQVINMPSIMNAKVKNLFYEYRISLTLELHVEIFS
jgi:hypothetical protein